LKNILVVYHSQQFGNTKILAEEIASGIRNTGGAVELINTNERRITLDDFLNIDAIALELPITIPTQPVRSKPSLMIFIFGTKLEFPLRGNLRFYS
jgi:flavorubredoxin